MVTQTLVGEPALLVSGLSKTFGGTIALDQLDLQVKPGEIHGLVGRNGSGKSTLVKILSGYFSPDRGARVELGGRKVDLPLPPGHVQLLGLSFVQQDLGLALRASVLENLRVGQFETQGAFGPIRWSRERALAQRALERVGLVVTLDAQVGDLRAVDRALIAVARALTDCERHVGGGLLLLDEPTTYLPAPEVEGLFSSLRRVAASGTGVLLVTHRLSEVLSVTDRVSVLRDGRRVTTRETASCTQADLVEAILGKSVGEIYPDRLPIGTDVVAHVNGLRGRGIVDASFSLRSGEILGVTGLAGMGHDSLPYLLFGAEPAEAGTLELKGQPTVCLPGLVPARAMALGIGLLPADRHVAGGVGSFSVRENVSLPVIGSFYRTGWLRHREELDVVQRLLEEFGVHPANPLARLHTLSGGNQQKAQLAKWLQREPMVFLAHEPTQGVDIGSRKEVFLRIRRLAASGSSVVICGSEFEDLAYLCHRVLVLQHGRIVAELGGNDLSEHSILEACYREASSMTTGSSERDHLTPPQPLR